MGNWAYRWPERPVPVREQVPASAAAGPGRARSRRPRLAGGETEASSRPGTAAAGPDVEPDVPAAWRGHTCIVQRVDVPDRSRRRPTQPRLGGFGGRSTSSRGARRRSSRWREARNQRRPASAGPGRARGWLDRLDRTWSTPCWPVGPWGGSAGARWRASCSASSSRCGPSSGRELILVALLTPDRHGGGRGGRGERLCSRLAGGDPCVGVRGHRRRRGWVTRR